MILMVIGSVIVFLAIIAGLAYLLCMFSQTDDPDPQYSSLDKRDGRDHA